MTKLSLVFLLTSCLNDCLVIIVLFWFCILVNFAQAYLPGLTMSDPENKENFSQGSLPHHTEAKAEGNSHVTPNEPNPPVTSAQAKAIDSVVVPIGSVVEEKDINKLPQTGNENKDPNVQIPQKPQDTTDRGPIDQKAKDNPPSPSSENSPPVLIHHTRPNQDPVFVEDYKMRMYAVETDKDPVGHVIDDDSSNPSGKILTSDPSERQISDEFVKVDQPGRNFSEEEEEEEEEEGEVVIPSLNKGRLHILKREESDDYSQPSRKLESDEDEVYQKTEPFIKAYLKNLHTIKLKKDKSSLQTDVIELDVPKDDSAAVAAGLQLSEMSLELEAQYRTIVAGLADKFFGEIRKSSGGVEPSVKLLLKNYKIIAEQIFKSGFNWSRLLVLLMFTFEIFQQLYVSYVPDLARNLIASLGTILVNIGLTAWILANGGWKMAVSGLSEENREKPTSEMAKSGKKCGCLFAQYLRPTQIAGAAGAVLAAGAAYYMLQRR